MNPSTRVVPVRGAFKYGKQLFVASTASVVGDVKMGELSSVWYGATLRGASRRGGRRRAWGCAGRPMRHLCSSHTPILPHPPPHPSPPRLPAGDTGSITVGRSTSVLDNALVRGARGAPVVLGDEVIVSPGAIVTGATVGDGAMIGMGAMVQAGARIGADAFIDAGAVVAAGTVVPAGSLWTGAPARQLRVLTPDEMRFVRSLATEYGALGARHAEQDAKSAEEVEQDAAVDEYKFNKRMEPEDAMPAQDPDIKRYYEMTADVGDSGLLRNAEFDKVAEKALREAEEDAADKAEEAVYYHAAHLR